jgi:phosphopantothenoylcysteine decarboxylase/phosphopantothenate--cysteine ligase
LTQKTLILGVSGSIAAYKALNLTRLAREEGLEVRAILTPGATRFVGPLSFSVLSGHRAVTDMWLASQMGEVGHVEWAHQAGVMLIAPATAETIANLAQGHAGDPVCAVALSTRAPLLIAPAMEENMWNNPATVQNVQTLKERGALVIEPESGHLASGREGLGRMAEPETILPYVLRAMTKQSLAGRKVVVTAGPTREHLDPVRFLSNPSTGQMGFAVAQQAWLRGAEVVVIAGPTPFAPPPGVSVKKIQTTEQMLEQCSESLADAHIWVMAAAPADYRPAAFSKGKMKKESGGSELSIEFKRNPDILTGLVEKRHNIYTVGFAAETGSLQQNAKKKLERKQLDLIVANDVTHPQAGFAVDTNVATLVSRTGRITELPVMPKPKVAAAILDHVESDLSD